MDFCVVFPNARFTGSSPEWDDWQVIDKTRGEARGFAQCVRAAFDGMDKAAQRGPRPSDLTLERAKLLAEHLRPRFESPESLASRDSALDEEYAVFLEDQFEALDQLEDRPDMLFEGAAGTGKTLLAIELAERALHSGQRVMVLCFNRLLAQYLKETLKGHENLIFCGTTAALATLVAGNEGAAGHFDHEDLFATASEVLLESPQPDLQFDVLIVDEVQDLSPEHDFSFLELLTEANGKSSVIFFGDFENQKLYFDQEKNRQHILEIFPRLGTYKMKSNCRNRPGFENLFDKLCGFGGMYRRYRLSPTDVVFENYTYENDSDRPKALENALNSLLKEFVPGQVAVLGTSICEDVKQLSQSLRDRIYESDDFNPNRKKIFSTTIRKFKGLETKALIIHDYSNSMEEELLYAGLTRAIEKVILVSSKSDITELSMKLAPRTEQ
jgi:Rad3-related DNA helicase